MPPRRPSRTVAACRLALALAGLLSGPWVAAAGPPLEGVKRVVVLGDSITYAGQYVAFTEACLRDADPSLRCEFLDLGLPSETVSGLSEPGHAGGKFPRPDLHERLGRVLEQTRPGLVVACYGMNDGIYYPLGEERFRKYREGVESLRAKVLATGAKLVLLTPPVFDPEPIRARTLPAGREEYRQPYAGYDDVLARYGEWLLSRRSEGWDVVDVHGPMAAYLAASRAKDPAYHLAGDGVHANDVGHWLIARSLLGHWGVAVPAPVPALKGKPPLPPGAAAILGDVSRKQQTLRDAWLTATGHKRPGIARGLPLDQAARQAEAAEARVVATLANRNRPGGR